MGLIGVAAIGPQAQVRLVNERCRLQRDSESGSRTRTSSGALQLLVKERHQLRRDPPDLGGLRAASRQGPVGMVCIVIAGHGAQSSRIHAAWRLEPAFSVIRRVETARSVTVPPAISIKRSE